MTPEPVVDDPKDPKDDETPKPPKDEPTFTAADKTALEVALAKERTDRRKFEKDARDAQAKLDAKDAEALSDTEKAEARATAAEAKVTAATDKLRKANLLSALADKGLTGAKAKAAARLLDGVEFSDDDEPKNLDDSLKAAKAEYGDDVFKGVKAPAAEINGGGGNGSGDGPNLKAEELAAAKSFGMTPEEYEAAKDINYQPPEPAKQTVGTT